MSAEDREFLDQIYKFIDENLKDMDSDPQKTPVSEQIQALRPILQELAMKYKMPVEDAFIKYMDDQIQGRLLYHLVLPASLQHFHLLDSQS